MASRRGTPQVPPMGSFQWPGRERLSIRERLLLESRSVEELLLSIPECEGELDSIVGYGEYLIMDWNWLRDAKVQREKPRYTSFHNSFLRDPRYPGYRDAIKWAGEIPSSNQVLERWVLPLN